MRTIPRFFATTSLVALSVMAAGCQSSPTTIDFTLVQPSPHVDVTDLGAKGDSPGDTTEIYAPLTRDGKPAGHLAGVLIIEDMPNEVVAVADREERLTLLNFSLPEGDIMVGGQAMYPAGAGFYQQADGPVVRPVIGGTKAYIGARGELTTTRQPDQSFTQQFHLIDVIPR